MTLVAGNYYNPKFKMTNIRMHITSSARDVQSFECRQPLLETVSNLSLNSTKWRIDGIE